VGVWNVPEDLMGTSFLKQFALALGASETAANLGATIPCSQLLTQGTCNETVAEHVVLGPLFTSPEAIAIAQSAYVATVCAATCKNNNDTFSQGFFGNLCDSLPYIPTPQDNASVYNCQYTTTEALATTEGETTAGTTKASGTTQANEVDRDTSGVSEIGLHHIIAMTMTAMISLS
jgi:hypothetical protein